MSRPVVVVTGAAGGVGQALVPRLPPDVELRLLDRVPVPDPAGAVCITGDVTDPEVLAEALPGADVIIHLAGERRTIASWQELTTPNLVGQHTLLAEAAAHGVAKVVLASSCHAAGQYDIERTPRVDPSWPARPCCRYGVSKAYGETAGRYAADRLGLQVIALRLGAVAPVPLGSVGAAFWLSLDDLGRVVRGALQATTRYGVYYAGSANVRERWNLEPGERDLGFVPQDDSQDYLDQIDRTLGGPPCSLAAV